MTSCEHILTGCGGPLGAARRLREQARAGGEALRHRLALYHEHQHCHAHHSLVRCRHHHHAAP